MASPGIQLESKKQVDDFCQNLSKEAEQLLSKFFPEKTEQLQMLLKTSFSCDDLASLKAPLDIPIPDPAKEEAKRKKKEEKEAKEGKKDKDSDKEEEDSGPPCGPICSNERVESLLNEVKPEIQTLKEKLNTVSMWVQLQIPRIEDGNNFGVAVQEKVFELLTNTRTKIGQFSCSGSGDHRVCSNYRDSPRSPSINVPSDLKEHQSVTVTCSAFTPCPHSPPELTCNLQQDSVGKTEKNTDGTFTTKIQETITLSDTHD